MSELQLFNTRTQCKEKFASIKPGRAAVYSCGPTVYSPQHIGNLRSVVFADLLCRALRIAGYKVRHVVNITDVGHLTDDADSGDDKMEKAARESGRRAADIAAEYTEQWLKDRAQLNCAPPQVLCKATEHIEDQIGLAHELEARGFAYQTADGLYFDTSKFPRYAQLARLQLGAQRAGARVAPAGGKRNPQDFALWKLSPPGAARQQEWDSPWGRGFPGWHLECSAMSTAYLGMRIDIHTGGVEHLPVHHTNETAQSESALGVTPWVNYWLHHDWIVFAGEGGGGENSAGEKLSKSKGGAPLLQNLVAQGFPPLALRYFFLQAHYRKQQGWGPAAMESAAAGYRRLRALTAPLAAEAEDAAAADAPAAAELRARFKAAMCDDLNAPQALAVAIETAKAKELPAPARRALAAEFDEWLGLGLLAPSTEAAAEHSADDARIAAQVAARETARRNKDWPEADRLRAALEAEGVAIEDTAEGPKWHRRN